MSQAPKMLSPKEVELNLRNWEKHISKEDLKACKERVDQMNVLFHTDPNSGWNAWFRKDKPFVLACYREAVQLSGRDFTPEDHGESIKICFHKRS